MAGKVVQIKNEPISDVTETSFERSSFVTNDFINHENNNPWQVDSLQAFVWLKCPECIFDTKGKSF